MVIEDEKILNGLEIKTNRYALGLTLEDLEEATGISKQMLSYMEKGQKCSKAKLLLCTLVFEKLWSKIPEDEICWRRQCAIRGFNVNAKKHADDVEFIKTVCKF